MIVGAGGSRSSRSRRGPARAALVLAATLGGCVSALRGPAELPALPAGIAPIPAPAADDAVRDAARLASTFDPASVARARDLYRAVAAADPTRVDALAGIAKSCVWLVDHVEDASRREADAQLAAQSARVCAAAAPDSAACWYWLGAGLGVLAREKPSTGVSSLPEIVRAFERAAEIDPEFDEAGPDRALALVYLRAPGWPIGPGDADAGLARARAAVQRHPEAPRNALALAEALAATDDRDGAAAEYRRAIELAKVRASAGDQDAGESVREAETALARLR